MDDHHTDPGDDAFNLLAMKALRGQLSPAEDEEFKAILAFSAQRQEEYHALLETHLMMRSASTSHLALTETSDIPEPSARKLEHLYQTIKDSGSSSKHNSRGTAQIQLENERHQRNWGLFMSIGGLGLAVMFVIAFLVSTDPESDASRPESYADTDSEDHSDLFAMRGTTSDDLAQNDVIAARPSAAPIAFVLEPSIGAIIDRGDSFITPTIGEALYTGDVLSLPDGQKMSVLLSNGQRMLEGPLTHTVTAPNAMLGISSPRPMAADTGSLLGTRGQGGSADLQAFVYAPASSALATVSMSVQRASSAITLYTPAGETALLNPVFDWESLPDATYSLELVNALDRNERFSLNPATPPVRLEALTGSPLIHLKPDNLYELTIRQDVAPLATSNFSFMTAGSAFTLPDDLTPAETLALMQEFAVRERWSDILSLGLTLPEEVRTSPHSLRLRALAHSKLSHPKAYEALKRELF